jgi:hypothetical protein
MESVMNAIPGTKYLLAKYIPDLRRYEPRNIGIIVWSPEGLDARFLGEKDEPTGSINGRSVPPFVTSLNAYKQWVYYWRAEIEKSKIKPISGGESVARDLPEFTEVLKTANRGNFVLEDGGLLLDRITSEQLPQLTDELFTALVETHGQDEPRDLTLDDVCDELLKVTKLASNPYFHNGFQVTCPVADTEEVFTFSHAYKSGSLGRLYQRVQLPRKRKPFLKKNVHDAAWTFEKVISAELIEREGTGALVYVGDEQRSDSQIQNALEVLTSVTRVINLSDRDAALHEFQQVAA